MTQRFLKPLNHSFREMQLEKDLILKIPMEPHQVILELNLKYILNLVSTCWLLKQPQICQHDNNSFFPFVICFSKLMSH